jgi:hypothetical protein
VVRRAVAVTRGRCPARNEHRPAGWQSCCGSHTASMARRFWSCIDRTRSRHSRLGADGDRTVCCSTCVVSGARLHQRQPIDGVIAHTAIVWRLHQRQLNRCVNSTHCHSQCVLLQALQCGCNARETALAIETPCIWTKATGSTHGAAHRPEAQRRLQVRHEGPHQKQEIKKTGMKGPHQKQEIRDQGLFARSWR